jgi:hypothetical protein
MLLTKSDFGAKRDFAARPGRPRAERFEKARESASYHFSGCWIIYSNRR